MINISNKKTVTYVFFSNCSSFVGCFLRLEPGKFGRDGGKYAVKDLILTSSCYTLLGSVVLTSIFNNPDSPLKISISNSISNSISRFLWKHSERSFNFSQKKSFFANTLRLLQFLSGGDFELFLKELFNNKKLNFAEQSTEANALKKLSFQINKET